MNFKNSSIVLLMLCLATVANAQNSGMKKGNCYFKSFNFEKAADAYKAASKKYPEDLGIKEALARTYVLMEDHANAEATYAEIVKVPTSQGINKLRYGQELRANGKYEEAVKAFNDYAQLYPNDVRSKELSNNLDKVKALTVDSKIYEVTNLAAQNSAASDMGAAFFQDGIVFSSNKGNDISIIRTDEWTGKRFYDMYVVKGDQNGNLYDTKLFKGKQPNRKYHEGPATFTADFKQVYFTRSNYVKSKAKKSKENIVKLKIFHADYDEASKKWVNIKEVSFCSNEYSVGHPTITKDGNKLYFISDMPGGYGETDVYVSYKDGPNWGPPINLGKNVNGPGREMFPYIAEDGTLYFSSDSKIGLGGLDVYSTTYAGGEWASVQNLGTPINSNADDFGYIINGKNENGYFVSNRAGGNGDDDIYKFKKNGISLCGTVVDARSREALPGSDVKLLEGDKVIGTKVAGAKGDFCFSVLPNKTYRVNATKTEYEPGGLTLTTKKENQVIQIPLSKTGGIDLSVCVTEKGKGTLVGATVELTNKATGEKKTCEITADCKCKFDLQPETDYEICASKESANANGSYDKPCKTISTKGKVAPASLYENLELQYLEEGMVIKIENLYYDLDKYFIRPDAAIELNKVLTLMQKFPAMEIELSSHTDCRATIKYNDQLSANRAKSCVDYLMKNGISGARLIAAGYGERKLVNNCACEGNVKSNCTEQQHQMNRRTEFKILKLK